jgi:hypothetical protein
MRWVTENGEKAGFEGYATNSKNKEKLNKR